MTGTEYLELFRQSLAASFDFLDTDMLKPLEADLYASLNLLNESYFLSRKIPLYTVKNNEYIIGKIINEPLTEETVISACNEVKKRFTDVVKVDSEHMSSVVTLAFFCEQGLEPQVRPAVKKLKYHKDFLFTLRGWADLAIICVDLANHDIISNKFGSKVSKNYQKILLSGLTR